MGFRISKYKIEKLGQHAEIQPGFAFKSERFTDNPSDVALVKGENVQQGFVDWNASKYWPAGDADAFKTFELCVGDVVLAMDRPWVTAGLKWAYIKKNDPKSLLVQRVARLRAKNGLDQTYLRCLISSGYFSNYLQPIVTGVNVPHISGRQIGAFKIPLPPHAIQRKIAAILSAYDELIENNKRHIALLEKLAVEIYREWFVRLRFPGHQNTQFEKGLPTDWTTKRVKKVVTRRNFGRIYREAELFDDGQVVVIDQSRADHLGFYNGEPQHIASPDTPIILFGDHTCKMVFMTKPFSLAENVVPFQPQPGISPYFLFHLVKDLAETTEYKRHWTELTNREVLIPKAHLQITFENAVRSGSEQIHLLREGIRKVEKLRASLLPRLISGKLSVENLDIQFPPGMAEELNAQPTATTHA